jgi:pimeloyl-ACP methyl ester carboxylesterase
LAAQYRLGLTSGFMQATLAALRGHVDPAGQRKSEVLLDELPGLNVPTLVVWGALDGVLPIRHARDAVARLRHGRLEIIPGCGHLVHVECPERFAQILNGFLDE